MEGVHVLVWALCGGQAIAFVRIEAAHPVTGAVHVLAGDLAPVPWCLEGRDFFYFLFAVSWPVWQAARFCEMCGEEGMEQREPTTRGSCQQRAR